MDFYLYLLTFIFLLRIKKLLLYFNILLKNSFIPLFKGDIARFDRSGIPKIGEWNSENEKILNSLGEWNSELFIICISSLFFRVFWGILLVVFSLYEFVYTK